MCLRLSVQTAEKLKFIANVLCLIFAFCCFLSHRETHAEDRPPAAGLHVPELHVAEDASGWRPVQVRWTVESPGLGFKK